MYCWAVHEQAELDLLCFINGKRVGFEFKWADTPSLNKSITTACDILDLEYCYIIYPGNKNFPLSETISVVELENYLTEKKV